MDLRDVAVEYDREALRALRRNRRDDAREMGAFLRWVAGNRDAADPTRLRLHLGLRLDLPERWCRRHGYAVTVGTGLTIQRDGEPAQVAAVGDTLHWDGTAIHVERGA